MNIKPLISIIIPVFNVQDYLDQCIESILIQDFLNFELVLINDGSTDNSGVISDKYSQIDDRIVVSHQVNEGVSVARNKGLELSRGNYVLFFDSDDYFEMGNALSILEAKIDKSNPDVIFYKINLLYANLDDISVPFKKFNVDEFVGFRNDELFYKLINDSEFKPSVYSKLVRKEILTKNKIFFKKGKTSSEDIEWFLKLFPCINSFDSIPDFIYTHRLQRPGAITNTIKLENLEDLLDTIRNEKERFEINDHKYSKLYRQCHYSYLAYQYTILMGLYSNLKDADKINIKHELLALKDLLNFQLYKRTFQISKINYIFGFNITSIILGYYIKLRNKGKVNL